jgi:diacylglycerol kinase family enzyme
VELGVPSDPAEACALVSSSNGVIRTVDVGKVGDKIFLTRIGMGLEANVIEQTDRAQKDRMGWLAYALNALRELAEPKVSRYTITIDGQTIETEGLVCMVANSGILSPNSGLPGKGVLTFAPTISVSDGLLDVIVIQRGNLASLLAVATSMLAGNENAEPLLHWQGREVHVVADPPQSIQLDGEVVGQTPVTAQVWPQALRVIVPADAKPPTATAETPAGQPTTAAPPPGQPGDGPRPVNPAAREVTPQPQADAAPEPPTEPEPLPPAGPPADAPLRSDVGDAAAADLDRPAVPHVRPPV